MTKPFYFRPWGDELVGEWLDGPWYMYSMSLLVLCTGHQYRSMNSDGRTDGLDGSKRIHHQINNIKMFTLHLLHLIIWMYCSGLWVVVKGEVDEKSKKAATTKLTTRHDREVQLDWSALWKMELKSICLKFAVCKFISSHTQLAPSWVDDVGWYLVLWYPVGCINDWG